jgi:hypothetical protein
MEELTLQYFLKETFFKTFSKAKLESATNKISKVNKIRDVIFQIL